MCRTEQRSGISMFVCQDFLNVEDECLICRKVVVVWLLGAAGVSYSAIDKES